MGNCKGNWKYIYQSEIGGSQPCMFVRKGAGIVLRLKRSLRSFAINVEFSAPRNVNRQTIDKTKQYCKVSKRTLA